MELLWPRRGERLLPALSAVLLAACFPPLHPLVLPFVGLIPFALWVQALPPDGDGRRAAVRGGLVFGLLHFGLLFYWILVALVWLTWMAVPAFLGAWVVLAGLAALVGWTLHLALHSVRAPLWLALPVAWTAAEWFRAHWPGPLAFPWLGLGTSLTGFPELVGMAEVVGARGVTFWLALLNGLGAMLLLRTGGRRRVGTLAGVTVLVLVVPPAWGIWRASTLEVREAARVAVVQPAVPEHIKLDAAAALDSTLASLDRLMPRLEPGSVQLVVMPEVTFTTYPRNPAAGWVMQRVQAYAREVGAPILFGSLGYEDDGRGGFVPFNSAFLMEPQGLADYQYDKRRLVPIVERVFGVGEGWPLAQVDETRFGTLICYESTYAEASRSLRLEGADVLLNITNDSWFGREALWTRTTALWQHPAHLVMRAIENRVGVARAANTGISLFVDPVGRVYEPTPLFEADLRAAVVYTTDVTTFYSRYGDLVGTGAALAALVLLLAAWRLGGSDPLPGSAATGPKLPA
ncbi:MAG: apolipoprotein N-acyltransferase [Longimicrobiales bacterium]|nr:apolipoprotein N-acyltransferase [Longimicrobiales bacterium]